MKESSILVFQKLTKQISNTLFSNTKISNTRSASTHAVPIRPFSHLHGNIWVVVVSFKGMHNICNVNKNNTVLKTSENNDSDHNEMSKENTTRISTPNTVFLKADFYWQVFWCGRANWSRFRPFFKFKYKMFDSLTLLAGNLATYRVVLQKCHGNVRKLLKKMNKK